jgi:hypothetical protein
MPLERWEDEERKDAPKRLNTKNRSTAPDIDVIGGGIRGGRGQQTDRIAIARRRN